MLLFLPQGFCMTAGRMCFFSFCSVPYIYTSVCGGILDCTVVVSLEKIEKMGELKTLTPVSSTVNIRISLINLYRIFSRLLWSNFNFSLFFFSSSSLRLHFWVVAGIKNWETHLHTQRHNTMLLCCLSLAAKDIFHSLTLGMYLLLLFRGYLLYCLQVLASLFTTQFVFTSPIDKLYTVSFNKRYFEVAIKIECTNLMNINKARTKVGWNDSSNRDK